MIGSAAPPTLPPLPLALLPLSPSPATIRCAAPSTLPLLPLALLSPSPSPATIRCAAPSTLPLLPLALLGMLVLAVAAPGAAKPSALSLSLLSLVRPDVTAAADPPALPLLMLLLLPQLASLQAAVSSSLPLGLHLSLLPSRGISSASVGLAPSSRPFAAVDGIAEAGRVLVVDASCWSVDASCPAAVIASGRRSSPVGGTSRDSSG